MLFLLLLAFLVPVTIYCLFLASLNRCPRPVMISGRWDFAGLLFAASGFFLVVVPGILITIYFKTIHDVSLDVENQPDSVQANLARLWYQWWFIWIFYYTALIAVMGLLVWGRQQKTVIYNIEAGVLEKMLPHVVEKLGLYLTRSGKQWLIHSYRPPGAVDLAGALQLSAPEMPLEPGNQLGKPSREGVLDVESFSKLCHVTLHWRSVTGNVREEVEAELAKYLKGVFTEDNPAGGWILGVGGFLLGLVFLIILLLVLANYFPPRRF